MINFTLLPLYPRQRPGTHCTGDWVDPRALLDGCGKISPPTGIRSPDRPVRSESLYRQSYPGPLCRRRRRHCMKLNYSGCAIGCCYTVIYTGCPNRYQTRHFFNNSNTNETDTFLFISHTTNVLLFKFRCNIFIGVRIIKEMPGSVASGTTCITVPQGVI